MRIPLQTTFEYVIPGRVPGFCSPYSFGLVGGVHTSWFIRATGLYGSSHENQGNKIHGVGVEQTV
jgi:hypothetical protein